MSIAITCYKNLSENNKVDKVLESVSGTSSLNTAVMRDESSIVDPVFLIEAPSGTALVARIFSINYIYVAAFNRYYFVNNITLVRNRLYEFTCHVDVLMSYKSQIRQNRAIIKKQEKNWNLYLNDGTFKVYQNSNVVTREFPSGFTSQSFVLAVAG